MFNAKGLPFTKTIHHSSYASILPPRLELSAPGKTILISGGGRGLGTGIVEVFAPAGAAHIVVTGRNADSLRAVATRIEATYPSTEPQSPATSSATQTSRAHLLRHSQSTWSSRTPRILPRCSLCRARAADEDEVQDWWLSFEVNVEGVFLLARHFLAHAAPGPVFVNVSATGAHACPPAVTAYMSSKLAAAPVVETLQAANPALRFFNVHPGVVKTELLVQSSYDALNPPMDDIDFPGMVWLASSEATFLMGG